MNEKKKSKPLKKLGSLLACAACLGLFFFLDPKEKKPTGTRVGKTQTLPANKVAKTETDSQKAPAPTAALERAPASIRKRPAQNKLKWVAKLRARLAERFSDTEAEVKVKPLEAIAVSEGGGKIEAQKVLISIDKGKGAVSSYQALVNPETGSIIQTWNRTHFENAKPLVLTMKPLVPSR